MAAPKNTSTAKPKPKTTKQKEYYDISTYPAMDHRFVGSIGSCDWCGCTNEIMVHCDRDGNRCFCRDCIQKALDGF